MSTKYARLQDDEDDVPYSQELQKQQPQTEPEPVDAEDATFKKRYGDLRRHAQQVQQQKDAEIEALRQQLQDATKQQIKFPKTEQEIEAWAKKYPDVAGIIDTIARKRANEALEEGEKRLSGLKKLEEKMVRERAEAELLALHPDFPNIRTDPKFHEWAQLQPVWIQDALYKNNTDAKAAARAIDLYKVDNGIGKTKAKTDPRAAATNVGVRDRSAPPTGERVRYTESMVQKMSPRDYEKHETAIFDAMRKGEFLYDISGAAR
jgi:hypothetical protein